MNDGPTTSWYVARRLDVGVDVAGPTLDVLAGEELQLSGTWGALTVEAAPVGLIRSRAAPHRRLRGLLRLPSRRPARVELELTPWSDDVTEIGIRPAVVPHGGRGRAYLDAAAAAIESLRGDLHTRVAVASAEVGALERAS
jgi:hypothetical protein